MRQEADIHRQGGERNGLPLDFDPSGLLDRLPGMAYRAAWDGDWSFEYASQGALDLTGYDANELADGRIVRWSQLIHDEDLVDVVKRYRQAVHDQRPFRLRYRIRTSERRLRWVSETGSVVPSGPDAPFRFEGYVIADEKAPAGEAATDPGGELARTLDQALDIFVAVDTAGTVTAWNRQAERRSGWSRSEALGRDLVDLVVEPEHRDEVRRKIEDLTGSHVAEEFSGHTNLRVLRRDGSAFPVHIKLWASDDDGRLTLNAFVRDRTPVADLESRVADLENRLERLSRIDELTGLASRAVLDTELARSVAFARRWRQPLSVVVVSPRPRPAEAESGETIVREALVTISEIIRTSCRTEDVAARFDETAILLLRQTAEAEAGIVADRLWRKIGMSESKDRVDLYVGMATLERGDSAVSLIQRALANLGPESPGQRLVPTAEDTSPGSTDGSIKLMDPSSELTRPGDGDIDSDPVDSAI